MKPKTINSVQTAIYHDSGFCLHNTATTKAAFAAEREHAREPERYIYSRYRNPTVNAVEAQLLQLEGAHWALLAESGMAAIDIALSLYQHGPATGKWLFFSEIYGGTHSYIDLVLRKRRGIAVEIFNAADGSYDLKRLERILDEQKPALLYLEAVSNPMLIVADVRQVIAMAKKRGIVVIVDNTFATPYLWKPLTDGADLVIHSATKYLAGHGNVTAGVLCGNDASLCQAAVEYRKWVGHMLAPDEAYRLGGYLKTFELRFARHCQNALQLATFLAQHEKVARVLYPGLTSHPSHAQAQELFQGKGFGGVVTIDLQGGDNAEKQRRCDAFVAALADTIPLVPTLGDADSILLPVAAVWGEKYPLPGMIRLSIGIEPYAHIERAIAAALAIL